MSKTGGWRWRQTEKWYMASINYMPNYNISKHFRPELWTVRSQLYQRRVLKVNTHFVALAKIYKMHFFLISRISNSRKKCFQTSLEGKGSRVTEAALFYSVNLRVENTKRSRLKAVKFFMEERKLVEWKETTSCQLLLRSTMMQTL